MRIMAAAHSGSAQKTTLLKQYRDTLRRLEASRRKLAGEVAALRQDAGRLRWAAKRSILPNAVPIQMNAAMLERTAARLAVEGKALADAVRFLKGTANDLAKASPAPVSKRADATASTSRAPGSKRAALSAIARKRPRP